MVRLTAMMPPKALTESQRRRLEVGVLKRGADCDAARIGVLDDGNRWRGLGVELRDQLEGRVGVVQIVVGELLALVLRGRRDAGPFVARHVERRALMRVLAIAQLLRQSSAEGAPCGRRVLQRLGEPIADRRVVGRRAGVGLGGEALTQRVESSRRACAFISDRARQS